MSSELPSRLTITPAAFFGLFLDELRHSPAMTSYYKFLSGGRSFTFRREYFLRRLEFLAQEIPPNNTARLWDVGCGYGTSAIFLSLNGYRVDGLTLEFYFDMIEQRKAYWSSYGDLSNLQILYGNVFDAKPAPQQYDAVILQDTLHHLEPLSDGLRVMTNALTPDGKIIAIEENGRNIVQRVKLYLRRGNKRIMEVWDDKLQRLVVMGNENIRSLEQWRDEFADVGMTIRRVEYIRLFPPMLWSEESCNRLNSLESTLWKKSSALRSYFFFGLNFTATRSA